MRTATLGRPADTIAGTSAVFDSTSVSGPGQNVFASTRAAGLTTASLARSRSPRCARSAGRFGDGPSRGRFARRRRGRGRWRRGRRRFRSERRRVRPSATRERASRDCVACPRRCARGVGVGERRAEPLNVRASGPVVPAGSCGGKPSAAYPVVMLRCDGLRWVKRKQSLGENLRFTSVHPWSSVGYLFFHEHHPQTCPPRHP